MKKIAASLLILWALVSFASCEYDDSNDIDFIIPNDTTESTLHLAASKHEIVPLAQ